MKKRNLNLPILTLLFAIFGVSGLQAQFDDLYYDESNFETVQYRTENISEDEEYVAYQNVESSDYDFDEYDAYVDYQNQGFDVDAYQYTNRFDNYRLAVFANNYYGYDAFSGFNNGFYGNLNRRIANDRFFAFYLRQELLFGPSFGSFYGGYNAFSPFGFNSVGLAFGNPYRGFGFNRGFGNQFGGFGGGFSSFGGGGFYCPPYSSAVVINNINNNNFTNSANNRAFTNSARATSSRTNLNSVRNTRISAPKATSSVRAKNIAVRDNSRASTATRSASTSTRSIRPSSTSSRTIERSRTGTSRSFSPTNSTRSTRSFDPGSSSRRSSFSPSNSNSRSSGAVRSSGSSSTRSARPASSSSSSRSVRKNN